MADNPKVLELRSRIGEIETELRTIHETAGDEPFTEEQQSQWDTLSEERAAKAKEQADLEARLARVGEFAASPANRESGDGATGAPKSPEFMRQIDPFDGSNIRSLRPSELRDKSLKVLDMRDYADHLTDRQKTHVDKVLRTRNGNLDGAHIARMLLATESDDYRSAFQKLACDGVGAALLTNEEARAVAEVKEIRAMSIGTDAAGGFGVPVLIDPTITLTAQGSPNDILRLARVETITNDEWKGVSSQGVSWRFGAEASAATDNSPTLAQPNVKVHKADGYIPYSIEVGMDYPGFASEMQTLLSEGYSELLAEKLTVGAGDGSSEPFGIVTALLANTNVKVQLAAASVVAAGDIYGLWDALPIRYRRGTRVAWMSSTDVQNDIRQLGTVDPNFTVNLTEEGIARMFGREYPVNDYMADVPASGTGNQALLALGDWVNYLVAQRAGMSIELVQHVFDVTNNRPTGQRAWYAWARVGADSINDLGFRLLVNKSS